MNRRPSLRSRVLAATLRHTVRPLGQRAEVRGAQLWALRTATGGIGPRTRQGGPPEPGRLTGEWVRGDRVRTAPASGPMVFYLHGGGYVFGSPRSHRKLAGWLSAASGLPVFVLDYRLAPEHPFPAALEDALCAYRALLDRGFDPREIAFAGDSAGAHLIGALLRELLRRGLPTPGAALMFSPALDFTTVGPVSRNAVSPDPFLPVDYLCRCAAAVFSYISPEDPRAAVLSADKAGWPPTLIQVGGTECLLDDARRVAASLRSAGVACELQIWPGQVHVFQGFGPLIPEARAAIHDAGRWLRDQLATVHLDQEIRYA
ncbi:alpha/beta hydrolase [Nocardia sp. CA-136227]|uniref:alpha/beta hydrolase n=1 Tax=Nocardia sp. CA-136227 TaxID=3239979 RepID=UPI003D98407C